jgi:glyoxylase I family protein
MHDFTLHHVALTVTDLDASRAWYRRLLGADPAIDEDVAAVAGHHKGFHHTIFVLPSGVILALHAHGGIAADGLGHGLAFRDPDNNALEFWAPRS